MASSTHTPQQTSGQREGQVVAGKFPLIERIGKTDHSTVYVTERDDGEKAALKLIPASQTNPDAQLARWKAASDLVHPHLLRIFEFGRCVFDSQSFLYVVTEFADENLSQVLPQRPLTPDEARPMLAEVVDTLSYLHARGLVHGRIKPSNIMAANDQLKISTDGICAAKQDCPGLSAADPHNAPEYGNGMTAAADIWSLGVTLIEAMTQRIPTNGGGGSELAVPPTLPQPFFDIARHALQRDPQQRWKAEQIAEKLKSGSPPAVVATAPGPQPMRERPRYLVPALIMGALVIFLVVLAFQRHPGSQPAAPPASETANTDSSPSPTAPAKPNAGTSASSAPATLGNTAGGDGRVLHRVLPAAAPSAMRTIRGHFRVTIRAKVDQAGNVTDARFASRGPSQYFARLSMDAARQWKFAPPAGEWTIQFKFSRHGIEDSARETSRSPAR